jgi:hypothetical protein
MKKRYLMILALAGMIGVAFASPSQAGSTLVSTSASFSISSPPGTTATDFEFEFTPVDPISGLQITSTNLSGATISEGPADTIQIHFTAATSGEVNFSYSTAAAPDTIGLNTFFLSGTSNPVTKAQLNVSVTTGAVPEPTSVALLGIGMTGFLAFRRFRKRGSAA